MNNCKEFLNKASIIDEDVAGNHIDNKIKNCIMNTNELKIVLNELGPLKPNIKASTLCLLYTSDTYPKMIINNPLIAESTLNANAATFLFSLRSCVANEIR